MAKLELYSTTDYATDICFLSWLECEKANFYCVEGFTREFLYEEVVKTQELSYFVPRELGVKYIGYRVKAMYVDQNYPDDNIILGVSDTVGLETVRNTEKIIVNSMRSYSGITLAFQTDEELDEYQLFGIKDGKKTSICSVNVSICHCREIHENELYYVEGFKFNDGKLTLCARSEVFLCKPLEQTNKVGDKPGLSVVIPAYNCEGYIARTIDSLLLSSYKDAEIIVVDDESTDNTGKICDLYVEKYNNIKCLHAKHGGISRARNIGMDEAKGEFIAFVDSDDVVHPLMYERLIEAAENNDSDIAIGQTYILKYEEKSKCIEQQNCMFQDNPYYSKGNVFSATYAEVMKNNGNPDALYFDAVWNKIIRTDIARRVHFVEECATYEDHCYTMAVYSYIDKFIFVKNAFYIWDCRKRITVGTNSTTFGEQIGYYVTWKKWILSRFNVLVQGNLDPNISRIYQKCEVVATLPRFLNESEPTALDKLYIAMMKYYVRVCKLDVEKILADSDEKLYEKWAKVENSGLGEFDGIGEIPVEIIK